jgi:hypothetical protein
MGDQPIARPLPIHRAKQTQNKRHTNIHAFEWDLNPRSQRSNERNNSCLKPRGHCDRHSLHNMNSIFVIVPYIFWNSFKCFISPRCRERFIIGILVCYSSRLSLIYTTPSDSELKLHSVE